MKTNLWIVGTAVFLLSQIASAIEFGGYFRTGIGATENGKTQECLRPSAAQSKL